MTKRLSFALRLSDVCLGRPLLGSEAVIYVDGLRVRHEYKTPGYFVVSDLSEGLHHVVVSSFKLQSARLDITVDYSPNITAEQRTHYLTLNPSAAHPETARLPSVRGRIKDAGNVYVLRKRGEMKIAEDTAQAGSTRLRLFCGGAAPPLPSAFRIMDKKSRLCELVTISGFDGEEYILSRPLENSYGRSAEVVPLIGISCDENGEFFFVIPPEFSAGSESGEIVLKIISVKESGMRSAAIKALPKGTTELGELNMNKET